LKIVNRKRRRFIQISAAFLLAKVEEMRFKKEKIIPNQTPEEA